MFLSLDPRMKQSPIYHIIENDSDEEQRSKRPVTTADLRRSHFWTSLPWVLALFFALTSVFQFYYGKRWSAGHLGTFEQGFTTDFDSAIDHIKIEQRRFTSGLEVDENGQVYMPHSDGKFIGDPTPEIDAAWELLIGGRYFPITKQEAISIYGHRYEELWADSRDAYITGVAAMHSLHCTNVLRQSLEPEHYASNTKHPAWKMHARHCVEHIREELLCMTDLTPVPWVYSPMESNDLLGYIEGNFPRTCRSFSKIREWVDGRRINGSNSVPQVHRDDWLERARQSYKKYAKDE